MLYVPSDLKSKLSNLLFSWDKKNKTKVIEYVFITLKERKLMWTQKQPYTPHG